MRKGSEGDKGKGKDKTDGEKSLEYAGVDAAAERPAAAVQPDEGELRMGAQYLCAKQGSYALSAWDPSGQLAVAPPPTQLYNIPARPARNSASGHDRWQQSIRLVRGFDCRWARLQHGMRCWAMSGGSSLYALCVGSPVAGQGPLRLIPTTALSWCPVAR